MTGWNMPDGVEDWMIPGNRPEDIHAEGCPLHDDAPELCVCGKPMDDHGNADDHKAQLDDNLECTCRDHDWDDGE